jgi:hypothetical protein
MGMESNRTEIAHAHSHTHCKAAQANAITKALQRVCLSQRLTKPTVKLTDEKEARLPNI